MRRTTRSARSRGSGARESVYSSKPVRRPPRASALTRTSPSPSVYTTASGPAILTDHPSSDLIVPRSVFLSRGASRSVTAPGPGSERRSRGGPDAEFSSGCRGGSHRPLGATPTRRGRASSHAPLDPELLPQRLDGPRRPLTDHRVEVLPEDEGVLIATVVERHPLLDRLDRLAPAAPPQEPADPGRVDRALEQDLADTNTVHGQDSGPTAEGVEPGVVRVGGWGLQRHRGTRRSTGSDERATGR